jgi:hypothetical protein
LRVYFLYTQYIQCKLFEIDRRCDVMRSYALGQDAGGIDCMGQSDSVKSRLDLHTVERLPASVL